MLDNAERQILALVEGTELERHLDAVTAVERLAGGEGEAQAVDYIRAELDRAGIEVRVHHSPAILSNPGSCCLAYQESTGMQPVPAKTRSFSVNTGGHPIAGQLIYVPGASLPADLVELQLISPATKDLVGKIVLSEAAGPAAILACARRGAAGFIQWWNGGEDLIHEGIVNPVWGTPQPGEDALYPSIPVAAVSGPTGRELCAAVTKGAKACLSTHLSEALVAIPAVEAVIHPASGNNQYLLVGSHLDSWFGGVTDNGTGNALAIVLAKTLHRLRDQLRYGARILWWSGHSNGRYAGSASYACDRFSDLSANCLAYMNIDMPGLRGATDYSRITAGPDLYHLARRAVADVVCVDGQFCGPVRGWDQSFQNIGISPYFIWASTLPSGHPDTTNNSLMPWWWHTEQDVRDYYDPEVLTRDAKLYTLAAWRLLAGDGMPFDLQALIDFARQAVLRKEETYRDVADLSACRIALDEVARAYYNLQSNWPIAVDEALFLIRKLNQLLYVEKGSHLQDWAAEQGFLPGLDAARLLRRADLESRQEIILRHFLACQVNRIVDTCETLRILLQK